MNDYKQEFEFQKKLTERLNEIHETRESKLRTEIMMLRKENEVLRTELMQYKVLESLKVIK